MESKVPKPPAGMKKAGQSGTSPRARKNGKGSGSPSGRDLTKSQAAKMRRVSRAYGLPSSSPAKAKVRRSDWIVIVVVLVVVAVAHASWHAAGGEGAVEGSDGEDRALNLGYPTLSSCSKTHAEGDLEHDRSAGAPREAPRVQKLHIQLIAGCRI